MEIKKIGVVGSGTMGSSIAYLMAFNGYETVLIDISDEVLDRAKFSIGKIIDAQIRFNGKKSEKEIERISTLGVELTEKQKEIIKNNLKPEYTNETGKVIRERIKTETDYNLLSECDIIIEAAFESLEVKTKIFDELSKIVRKDAIVASNSSSISVTQMAGSFVRPERFILTHFFNPPYTLPLVEVVRGLRTENEVFETVMTFFGKLKNHRGTMKPISVKEVPGFLVNRILVPMINEAFIMLDENVASARDIDSAMRYGAGMPMGPLELADMVGIDITYDVMKILYEEYSDSKYRPSNLLKKYKNAKKLGRKTNEGVYNY